MKSLIEQIQDENPSYDPLNEALFQAGISMDTWKAATDRVYFDGYYGPISADDWKEQDGREPYTVSEALTIISKVLDEVESYYEVEYCEPEETETTCTGHSVWDSKVDSSDIKAALVAPWYSEIYGVRYP